MSARAPQPEVVESPLNADALALRYRDLCADPLLANLPGKIELDNWGRILMSPASNYHGTLQGRLVKRLAALGGEALVEASVLTSSGVLVADVAWASGEFMRAHASETPFTRAPELCIEVASPSNSRKELAEKVDAYLQAGALEAWIVYAASKRIDYFTARGAIGQSSRAVDLTTLFD